ncbi:Xaa-Pro peptidase family protein [Sphingomonas sp. LB-2]|uniref:M24 family metallopeptidase n=1 Tax=Sphingomonas caeni TaxID=2984949 RepID=UPI00222E2F73|nr:Xaa-Pro peptidase family protein [Sphingomonas caeni]MCW3849112.1 Xaa-Pro peptidase family protein [Sphingomonas caeni]
MFASRRTMLKTGLKAAATLPLLGVADLLRAAEPDLAELQSLTAGAQPIGEAERRARIARAQALMAKRGIGAVLIEAGSSLVYFTGINWSRSERLTCAILPVEGDPCIVTPFFEAPRTHERLGIPAEVRVWQEDEDPLALVAGLLKERKLANRPVGIEETDRYFIVAGLQQALPGVKIVPANPVVRGCRMIKTAPEIALLQLAADVTIAAYRWAVPRIEAGMNPAQIGALMNAATEKLGGDPEFALILLGEAAAYPHGTGKPQKVTPGEVVLMDCGCTVHGYQSDISRTLVHGTATPEQRKVWDQVRHGQAVAFEAAQLGVPAGHVDDAVRRYYVSQGYGPDYKLPGLSHRTGHGIGLDGHEPVNLVRGEKTPLGAGMCFSNEPGIYIPGSFGVRLEDCFHMTETGPQWFSVPPSSIDAPLG